MMIYEEINQLLTTYLQEKQDDYGILRLGVFGSAARGELTDHSDVDVVVELKHPDLFILVAIKQDLETLFRCDVDVVRYRENMNSFLQGRIEQEAKFI